MFPLRLGHKLTFINVRTAMNDSMKTNKDKNSRGFKKLKVRGAGQRTEEVNRHFRSSMMDCAAMTCCRLVVAACGTVHTDTECDSVFKKRECEKSLKEKKTEVKQHADT